MSRENSVNTLMGFSVHQPTIGAALQFFPAMGSQQLDDMINAYVPGPASILDKRAAVSVEFFEHVLMTGETFKFFMVYNTASPAMDSGYASSFTTSPTMSNGQWQPSTNASAKKASSSSSRKMSDFSELPGMKILTKDGRDVTNSVSRGCKTKEQRDHAHLMRIIKACESCKKKKTKCDPSHKRSAGSTSSSKITKKTIKSARPAAAPSIPTQQTSVTPTIDQFMSDSFASFDSSLPESYAPIDPTMDWEQFLHFDEEPVIPYNYDFSASPVGYFTPAASTSFTSPSTSSHTPITPVDQPLTETHPGTFNPQADVHAPTLPYLNPGGLESSSNYVDFNLYSAPSSPSLDEDLGTAKELVASPQPEYSDYMGLQYSGPDRNRQRPQGVHQPVVSNSAIAAQLAANNARIDSLLSSPVDIFSDLAANETYNDSSSYRRQTSSHKTRIDTTHEESIGDSAVNYYSPYQSTHDLADYDGLHLRVRTASAVSPRSASNHAQALVTDEQQVAAMTLSSRRTAYSMSLARETVAEHVVLGATSEGLYGRDTIANHDQVQLQARHSSSRLEETQSPADSTIGIPRSRMPQVPNGKADTMRTDSRNGFSKKMSEMEIYSSNSTVKNDGSVIQRPSRTIEQCSYAGGLPTPISSPREALAVSRIPKRLTQAAGITHICVQNPAPNATQLAAPAQHTEACHYAEPTRDTAATESPRQITATAHPNAQLAQGIVSGIGACAMPTAFCFRRHSISSRRGEPAGCRTSHVENIRLAEQDLLVMYAGLLLLCLALSLPTAVIASVALGTLSFVTTSLRRETAVALPMKANCMPALFRAATKLCKNAVGETANSSRMWFDHVVQCGLSHKIAPRTILPSSLSSTRHNRGNQPRGLVAHTIV